LPGTHWVTAVGRTSGLSAQSPFLVQTAWSMFRDVASHKAWNATENVLGPNTIGGLGQAWTAATGLSVYSSPAVANGTVYVGSNDGKLYALDASSGAVLWSTATGSIVVSSPAVANGVVYVGSGDHNVYAFNATTGATLWITSTGGGI